MLNFNELKDLSSICILIENKVTENLFLEYKKLLNLDTDEQKRELCKDISSFANSEGGIIIYGVSEKNGYPDAINGLNVNPNEEELRIRQILDSGIFPKLIGLEFKWIQIDNSKIDNYILLIKINPGINAPYQVIYKKLNKFYKRKGAQVIEMDWLELKNSFTIDNIFEKIVRFRNKRIKKLKNENLYNSNEKKARIVIHIIPSLSFKINYYIDLNKFKLENNSINKYIPTIFDNTWNEKRYNIDGLMLYNKIDKDNLISYLQVFRNGIVEIVDDFWINLGCPNQKKIPVTGIQNSLLKNIKQYINFFEMMNIQYPIFLFLTILNAKGYKINFKNNFPINYDQMTLDRNTLFFPEIIIEKKEIIPELLLKPLFDSLWNAFGYDKCLNYDENGNYKNNY